MQRLILGRKQSNIFKIPICGSVISLLGMFPKEEINVWGKELHTKKFFIALFRVTQI